jgi:hypothetical protein
MYSLTQNRKYKLIFENFFHLGGDWSVEISNANIALLNPVENAATVCTLSGKTSV